MGFLHDGHASLMRAAAQHNDVVVASIFVNPLQFAADEDLDDYPRDLVRDTELAQNAGVHYLFVPERDQMYPIQPVATMINVAEVDCGKVYVAADIFGDANVTRQRTRIGRVVIDRCKVYVS